MQAIFKTQSDTYFVPEFNSPKAKLAFTDDPILSLTFTHDVFGWIEEGAQERDKAARRRWIQDCYQQLPDHPAPERTTPPKPDHDTLLYSFVDRIQQMNETFAPITCYNTTLTNLGAQRIKQFMAIIENEVREMSSAIATYPRMPEKDEPHEVDFVQIADCLGDLAVFVFSEAGRWGIPLLEVLCIIMDSQASKLVNGQPIPHPTEPGKFGKGPSYFPPEDKIRELLENYK